jgi:superfamily II DNA or RNA helicase/HKD family nuclease
MSFQYLKTKTTYSSEEDSLLQDFYIPVLSKAVKYDRAVGYFSSSMLVYAMQGLSDFVKKGGRMRLIIGDELDEQEYDAVKSGYALREVLERFENKTKSILEEDLDHLAQYRLRLLSLLISNGHLEIKLALRRKGMYHDKVGILEDEEGNQIVFQGSANETFSALSPDFNYESISVYSSERKDVFDDYGLPYKRKFERLWNNNSTGTIVIDVPSEHYEKFKTLKQITSTISDQVESELFEELKLLSEAVNIPRLPDTINGQKYELKPHQREALNGWKANNGQGILALATGAGKTITSIHAAVKLSETGKLALVIGVPYQVLADQWVDVLSQFNIQPVKCYMSESLWINKLRSEISTFNLSSKKNFIAAVVVNATLSKQSFQNEIAKIADPNRLLFIGDECHNYSNESWFKKLPNAGLRIGLSATPWSVSNQSAKGNLTKYFGDIIARYTIDDALDEGILTQYKYYPHIVYLNAQEQEDYLEISGSISQMMAMKENGQKINDDILTQLFMKRARLLGSIDDKFRFLDRMLSHSEKQFHTLFYCGDGTVETDELDLEEKELKRLRSTRLRDVQRVSMSLNNNGWKSSRFTSEVPSNKRKAILNDFKAKQINAVVAIRVLDEGFDLPDCREAYLIASSRNERQFIQRRGRILRKSDNKAFSIIHDFIVLPIGENSDSPLKSLVRDELKRVDEFSRVALNKDEVEVEIQGLIEKFNISEHEFRNAYIEEEALSE